MIIAIASGKGGTGKTTVAVSLAMAVETPVTYLDCDVEEPNGQIFIKPHLHKKEPVNILVPEVDKSLCNGCGECSKFCQFNAIISLGGTEAIVFADLCHSCGGCKIICPCNAIKETETEIGHVEIGKKDNIHFVHGKLDISKSMSPPVIRAVKSWIEKDRLTIIDCPPGTACPMVTAVSGADYTLLVTEPTPFGLNDLKIAVETLRLLNIPFGVVLNRFDAGDDRIIKYCGDENIKIIMKIPDKKRIAESYSRGESLLTSIPSVKKNLLDIITIAGKEIENFNQGKK